MYVGDNHDFIETNSIPYQYKWQADIYAQLQVSNTREMVVDETEMYQYYDKWFERRTKDLFCKGYTHNSM